MPPPRLPKSADLVVVGGGTAGAVVAGLVAAKGDRSVLVLEAGPDYGPFDGGEWPADLLDARGLPTGGHDWGYHSSATYGARGLPLERARVIGGCSAHNGCAAVWGHRLDYDGWERLGNPGWGADALRPYFERANQRLRVHTPPRAALGPFHEAVLGAAPSAGLPLVDDLNDLDGPLGMAVSPINVADGVRWNSAFAYLDPVRGRRHVKVVGGVLVDRVVVERGRAVAVELVHDGRAGRVACGEVVLAAGAYGSPAVLLRSGIGPADHLRAVDVAVAHELPGVGENLQDHPALVLEYSGTPELVAALRAFMRWAPLREEGTIAKARSSLCREAFDLHVYPFGGPCAPFGRPRPPGERWTFAVPVACMTPRSRGRVRLAGRDSTAAPIVDHAYLTDPDDHDRAVLLDGVELARALAAQPPLRDLLGVECGPSARAADRGALRRHVRTHGVHYYHPVGSCKMGSAADRAAVVDAQGRVHGIAGLRVADASVMPVIPRANTNLPTVVVGERIAAAILGA